MSRLYRHRDSEKEPIALIEAFVAETTGIRHDVIAGATTFKDTIQLTYEVCGEPFYIERENEIVYLRHARWSLIGEGTTLGEAEQDLIREAFEVAEVLSKVSIHTLDSEAQALRDFVLKVA